MSPTCLLLAVLIALSTQRPSAQHPQRYGAPTSNTLVGRLHSEISRVIGDDARPTERVPLVVRRVDPDLTRVDVVRADSDQSSHRMWSRCWWLWILSGLELC